jgi:hypothetical protein
MQFGDVVFYLILWPILIILFWLAVLEPLVPVWGAWIVSGIVDIYVLSKYKFGFWNRKHNLKKSEESKDARRNI